MLGPVSPSPTDGAWPATLINDSFVAMSDLKDHRPTRRRQNWHCKTALIGHPSRTPSNALPVLPPLAFRRALPRRLSVNVVLPPLMVRTLTGFGGEEYWGRNSEDPRAWTGIDSRKSERTAEPKCWPEARDKLTAWRRVVAPAVGGIGDGVVARELSGVVPLE